MTTPDDLLDLALQQSEYITAMLDLCHDWKDLNDQMMKDLGYDGTPTEDEIYDTVDKEGQPQT